MTKKNPFESWQQQRMVARETLIKEFLAQSQKSKANYPNVTALAVAVAKYISTIEDNVDHPCSSTTILRNLKYKNLLTHYLANQRGAKHVSFEALPDDRAKAAVTGLQLENLTLRQDNERLQRYIEVLDKEMEDNKSKFLAGAPTTSGSDTSAADTVKRLENDLGRTCMVINKILERFPDILALEPDFDRIVDLSVRENRPERVIAKEVDVAPYFYWLRRNAGG